MIRKTPMFSYRDVMAYEGIGAMTESIDVWDLPDNSAIANGIRRNPDYCPCGLDRFLNSKLGQAWVGRTTEEKE